MILGVWWGTQGDLTTCGKRDFHRWIKKPSKTERLTEISYENRHKLAQTRVTRLCQSLGKNTTSLQENKQNVRRPLASPPQLYVCPIHEAVIVLESNHCATSEYKGLVAEFSDLTSFPPYPTKYKMLRLLAYSSAHTRIHVGVMMTPVCLVKSVLIWTNYTYFAFNLDLLCKSLPESQWYKNTSRLLGFTSTLSRLLWR